MRFSLLVDKLQIPNLPELKEKDLPLEVKHLKPLSMARVSLAPALENFHQEILAFNRSCMPKHDLFQLISDFETLPTDQELTELRNITAGLTDYRRFNSVGIVERTLDFLKHRPHWHFYLLELIDAQLHKDIYEVEDATTETHQVWLSHVIDAAIADVKQCNFGAINLPRILPPPAPKNYPTKVQWENAMSSYRSAKYGLYKEMVMNTLDSYFHPFRRALQTVAAEVAKEIRVYTPNATKYSYFTLEYDYLAGGLLVTHYGDLRVLKHNVGLGFNHAE